MKPLTDNKWIILPWDLLFFFFFTRNINLTKASFILQVWSLIYNKSSPTIQTQQPPRSNISYATMRLINYKFYAYVLVERSCDTHGWIGAILQKFMAVHDGKKSTIVADCVEMKRWNPISRFISGTRDLHHHHYSPLYRSLCLSLWDNSPCDFTYSRLQFTSKWKEDPAEDCLSTHFSFFSLQLSVTLFLLCGGTRGENKPSCIFYLRFKFHCSKLQMWAAGHSNSSNCRPEAEGGGKARTKLYRAASNLV